MFKFTILLFAAHAIEIKILSWAKLKLMFSLEKLQFVVVGSYR